MRKIRLVFFIPISYHFREVINYLLLFSGFEVNGAKEKLMANPYANLKVSNTFVMIISNHRKLNL